MSRDPRKDPRPGDVVIYGPQWQIERVEVVKVTDHGIDIKLDGRVGFWTLRQWLDWTDGSEVLHVAE